jgi:hypothetical protein
MSYGFPPNPTVGQTYSTNGRTWRWSGVSWQATVVPTTTSAPVYISVSPPPNPVPGSLWYNSVSNSLNIYYKDLNGSQWVAVVPYPEDSIDQNGGVFEGAIYANYLIPNNDSAFVTVGWVNERVVAYLNENGYMRSGNGVTIDSTGQITAIDSGIVV